MKRNYLVLSTAALLCLIIIYSCGGLSHKLAESKGPKAFRSVLDLKPRMLTIRLADSMWVAYNTATGGIYRAWKDGVNLDGAVYTTAHGPQPTAEGLPYLIDTYDEDPWQVSIDGKEVAAKPIYRGHRIQNDQVTIKVDLQLPDGHLIHISEQPTYENTGKYPGVKRSFSTSNVPDNAEVNLRLHVNSVTSLGAVQSNQKIDWVEDEERIVPGAHLVEAKGLLHLKSNGKTSLAMGFHPAAIVEPEQTEEMATYEGHPGNQLIERSDCKTCHNAQVKTIGPAYISIAEKYTTSPATVAQLAQKVINGGSGVWGSQMMTAHPTLAMDDARQMVDYILTLDGEAPLQEMEAGSNVTTRAPKIDTNAGEEDAPANGQGLAANFYQYGENINAIPDIEANRAPVFSAVLKSEVNLVEQYGDFGQNIAATFQGTITIPQSSNYVFRLVSDDGSRLFIDGKLIIDHDGPHGMDAMDGEVLLQEGTYPFLIDYYQGGGGSGISLQWIAYGENEFTLVPGELFAYKKSDLKEPQPFVPASQLTKKVPGDGFPLEKVHPSFDLSQARPEGFEPKVGGMDFTEKGDLVVSTWDSEGAIYLLSNLNQDDPEQIKVKKIASGLAEPLGVKVVDGDIYILQKQELTKLIDHDDDDIIDEYQTICAGWRVSANFHEFAFGLVYKDGYFYATLATAINPGGASTQPQIPDRGKIIKISKEDGSMEFMAHGLRTPNGIGIGYNDEMYIADNQGDWLPASKIVHVQEGAFYGSRSVDFEGTADLEETLPVIWLPQDEIGNSPSQPGILKDGPYSGHMIHGEVTNGGIKRVYVEEVGGQYQGALFRFTQGLEAGVNRIAWSPSGELYIGGIGNPGNWGHFGKKRFGLQKIKYNAASTFEMLSVSARSNGMMIEFTEPLAEGSGLSVDNYLVKQWYYLPTANYGGPKMAQETLPIQSVNVSQDRKKVFLELSGMKEGHMVYVQLQDGIYNQEGEAAWTTECWYNLNKIPGNAGELNGIPAAPAPNTLTASEQSAGWKLLFDGQSMNGWKGFKKDQVGSAWKVEDGTMTLEVGEKDDWQVKDGGDIMTVDAYDNYELSLEWKIAEGGNSGIIYHVQESDAFDYVWKSGPEMQVLDNERHPDAQIEKHRAGDLYDMIESEYVAVNPANTWNRVRIVSNNGKMQHWLNGHLVVAFDMNTEEWKELVAGSKFGEMPEFGTFTSGHIAIQDHGDRVWYRNIKIRPIGDAM